MAWLLGTCDVNTLGTHVACGELFETFVVGELIKQRYNRDVASGLHEGQDCHGMGWQNLL